MNIKYHTYHLKFRHPFTISKGTKTHQSTFIVELDFMGIKGYGEAPAIAYYNIPVEKMAEDLEAKKTFVEKFAFTEPERYWHYPGRCPTATTPASRSRMPTPTACSPISAKWPAT